MPLLEIDQATVASPIDGRFHGTGSTWLPTFFNIVAAGHLGHFMIGTLESVPCGFFRFKIPLATGEATINHAQIKFYTVPDINYDFNAGIKVNILAHDDDNSPGPSNHADCITQSTTQATSAVVSWEDPDFPQYNPGQSALVVTVDFKAVLEEIFARAGWVKNNYVTIYLISTAPIVGSGITAQIKLQTKSHSDYYSGYDDVHTPRLLIDVTYNTGSDHNVNHDLVIADYNTAINYSKHVEDALVVTQDVDFARTYNKTLEDSITVDQNVAWAGTKPRDVFDVIVIDNLITGNQTFYRTVNSDVTLGQDIVRNSPKDKQVFDDLDIQQDIVKVYVHDVIYYDNVIVDQDIRVPLFNVSIYDDINIEDDVEITGTTLIVHHDIVDTLTIDQTIIGNVSLTRAVEHTLSISQSILVSGPSTCREDLIYKPVADDSVGFAIEPTLINSSLILEYPVSSPTTSVILRPPLLGSREELQVTRIQRETRGGDLKTFVDSNWPQIHVLRFKFEQISDTLRDDYNTFTLLSLGLRIKLTDYEGRVWTGHILTPEGESVTLKDDTCSDTLEFDFVGILT